MKTLKALLVDDVAVLRALPRAILEKNFPDIDIEEVEDGEVARLKIQKTNYDVILSDWEMPRLSGYQLLKWLRSQPQFKDTAFIMITSISDEDKIAMAFKAGSNAYLIKPYSIEELVRKMTEVVDKLNRRQFKRFYADGAVNLFHQYDVINGKIIDISKGGMFGTFGRRKPVPNIHDKVLVDISLKNGNSLNGLKSSVNRIQPVEQGSDVGNVRIAFKFLDIPFEHEVSSFIAS